MEGPGKYDDVTTMVRALTEAQAVVLMVIDGNQGNGFSVQAYDDIVIDLPALLRTMADEIEKEGKEQLNGPR